MSHKSSAVGVVYSDASDTGFGGFFVQCGVDFVYPHVSIPGFWNPDAEGIDAFVMDWTGKIFYACPSSHSARFASFA